VSTDQRIRIRTKLRNLSSKS